MKRRLDADLAALAALAVPAVLRFVPDALLGLTPFWGDLTYIHQPWRAFDAQLLQAGRLPLWNPFLYFGMPQAATMQDGLYYPGTAPFWLFKFAHGLLAYHLAHYWLAAALTYLALRSLKLGRLASCGGAVVYAFGGTLLCREPFLNHLAVLSLAPAFLLFFRSPVLLAVALWAAFLAGYPTFLPGAVLAAWAAAACAKGFDPRSAAKTWTTAGLASLALSGVLLLPAWELVGLSRRASGVELDEALGLAFAAKDLLLWISPWLQPGFNAAVHWHKCCYAGLAAVYCAATGLAALKRRWPIAALLVLTVLLVLGSNNPISNVLWSKLPPLRYVRYPGNLSYLAALPLGLLAAAGLQRSRWRRPLAAAILVELVFLAHGAMPRAKSDLHASKGKLAFQLQHELEGHRYMISPRALHRNSGSDVYDWRHRLFGLSAAPVRLRAAANFGEPLVPKTNYALMDALLSAKSPEEAAGYFPWADIRALLTPEPLKSAVLVPAGKELWAVHHFADFAGARLLTPGEASLLPEGVAMPKSSGTPYPVLRPREDLLTVTGGTGGWLYVAEPLYPGWTAWLETPRGAGTVRPIPALGPFQKLPVPNDQWSLNLKYDPASFRADLALTLVAFLGLLSFAQRRLRA